MTGEIGIIYPPPELRNIVDKTASFVARNGPEFESRIQQNEQNNPKFNFLKHGDPYHGYYQHKVNEIREGGGVTKPPAAPQAPNAIAAAAPATNSSGQPPGLSTRSARQLESLVEAPIIIRDPPPEFEYSAEPPSLSAVDLDIVKLTAQFVAIHGRSFLTNLMSREQRNFQFDFLRPQHGLFSYFTQLIEQYSKILAPQQSTIIELKKELASRKTVVDKVRYRLEWTKIQEAERRREEEEAERERVQYAQIDWHDFVVVETVDYQPHEQGMFPPPTTPEQVGSRILLQARIEEQGNDTVEMDVDSDEEDAARKEDKAKAAMPPPPPLPPSLDNVLIRKDYNPKAKAATISASRDSWAVSPITGEKVPAAKLDEHMRYALLDPRWVEERERSIIEKSNKEEVFAPGPSIDSSLKNLAERRTDIFGSGDVETAIGQKIGEEERRKPEKITWDGYSSSAAATTRAARENVTIEEHIQHIHRSKGFGHGEDKDRIGPAAVPQRHEQPPPPPPQHNVRHHHQHHAPSGSSMQPQHNLPSMSHHHGHTMLGNAPGAAGMMIGATGNPYMLPTPVLPYQQQIYGGMGAPLGLHDMSAAMGGYGMQLQGEEPSAKKQKTEENLIAEDEFLKSNPGPVTFQIIVPLMSDKPEWNLNGQSLTFTMPLSETINGVKSKIHEQIGMPPGKQKLQYEGMFVKDSNTLAFYNMPNGSTIVLALKERGGRKK